MHGELAGTKDCTKEDHEHRMKSEQIQSLSSGVTVDLLRDNDPRA
jgi:hypothetical protein